MKFDENNVVSYLDDNLDDEYIGKEGYFSDYYEVLESMVELGIVGYENAYGELVGYEDQKPQVIQFGIKVSYTYFYPIGQTNKKTCQFEDSKMD